MGIERYDQAVQGAAHVRRGIPLEDCAMSWELGDGIGLGFAMADGHGDPACVRSAEGAKQAVRAARLCLDRLPHVLGFDGAKPGDSARLNELQSRGADAPLLRQLAEALCRRWREAVCEHFSRNPLTEDEQASAGKRGRSFAKHAPEKLYGTTLLAGIMLPGLCVLLQQGDGCCVAMYADGSCAHPIPDDEMCAGSLTTSLSDADADKRMRFAVLDLCDRQLIACLVASDGVEKSFAGVEGMDDFARGLALGAAVLEPYDYDAFQHELRAALEELSANGSADDASVAGFVDLDAVREASPTLEGQRERYERSVELEELRERLASMQRKRRRILADSDAGIELPMTDQLYLQTYADVQARISELEELGIGGTDAEQDSKQRAQVVEEAEQDSRQRIQVAEEIEQHNPDKPDVPVDAPDASAHTQMRLPQATSMLPIAIAFVLGIAVGFLLAITLFGGANGVPRPSAITLFGDIWSWRAAP